MLISLTEWAKKNNLKPNTARIKAASRMIPAKKIGRNWVIDEKAENIDHRYKEHRKRVKGRE